MHTKLQTSHNNKKYDIVGLGKWTRELYKYNPQEFQFQKDNLPEEIKSPTKTHPTINTKNTINIPNSELRQLKLNDTLINIDISNEDYMEDKFTRIYDLRRAAEIHKTVRKNIQEWIQPNTKLIDICNKMENEIINIIGYNDLRGGVAFPTGLSLNNCICHDTANFNDPRMFKIDDLCKIDFGVHLNGNIIDCAFSVCFNQEYEPLLNASKEATYMGIKLARPDMSIYEISCEIKEIIESYQVTIRGKTYDIKAIKDLGGHSINQYDIHSGQIILCSPYENKEYKADRIRSDQQYAIETFASTGTGNLVKSKSLQSNHYMLNKTNEKIHTYKNKLNTINNVCKWIKKNRSTLAFCPRWLEDQQIRGVGLSLNEFSRKNDPPIVVEYPPLDDIDGSLVSHFEHTIYVHDNWTEVFTFGDDY